MGKFDFTKFGNNSMERKKYYRTDFLFANVGLLIGIGSIFNVAGGYFEFNYSDSPDEKAIESDWGVIGNDIEKTVEQNPQEKFKLVASE